MFLFGTLYVRNAFVIFLSVFLTVYLILKGIFFVHVFGFVSYSIMFYYKVIDENLWDYTSDLAVDRLLTKDLLDVAAYTYFIWGLIDMIFFIRGFQAIFLAFLAISIAILTLQRPRDIETDIWFGRFWTGRVICLNFTLILLWSAYRFYQLLR